MQKAISTPNQGPRSKIMSEKNQGKKSRVSVPLTSKRLQLQQNHQRYSQ